MGLVETLKFFCKSSTIKRGANFGSVHLASTTNIFFLQGPPSGFWRPPFQRCCHAEGEHIHITQTIWMINANGNWYVGTQPRWNVKEFIILNIINKILLKYCLTAVWLVEGPLQNYIDIVTLVEGPLLHNLVEGSHPFHPWYSPGLFWWRQGGKHPWKYLFFSLENWCCNFEHNVCEILASFVLKGAALEPAHELLGKGKPP